MANEDRFKQPVIVTLAKRAANRCSNPDCGAITSGPADTPNNSVNVGEAAHIYGANPGSARYRAEMTSLERADISNAIWLCNNCHKLIDDDEVRFPAGLLFEWQRSHEQRIAEQVGKAGAELRQRYEDRHLEEFGRLSYVAERIIVEKGSLWEYRLTAEVLRKELSPILRRWNALKRGIYVKPSIRIKDTEFFEWISRKAKEMIAFLSAFSEILNIDFQRAWGAPGFPGDDLDIIETCRLLAELCQSALIWEEDIKFSYIDEIFSEFHNLHCGLAGILIDEAAKVPAFLSEKLATEGLTGKHILTISPDLPAGWSDKVQAAMARATEAYHASLLDKM